MRIKLFTLLIIVVSFSCKKADFNKELELKSDAPATPIVEPVFGNFTSKSILASTPFTINNIVPANNNLYIVGNFSSLATASSRAIVTYDGTSFSAVSNNFLSGSSIRTVEYFNNRLLIGGSFATSTTTGTRYFGYFSGTSLATYSAIVAPVYSFYNSGTECYMGGYGMLMTSPSRNVASFNLSSALSSYGSTMVSGYTTTNAMASFNGTIFMGGDYTAIAEKNIVYDNGGVWQKSGLGFSDLVSDLEVYNNKLYAGGNMNYTGDYTTPMNFVNYLTSVSGTWQKAGTNNLPGYCYSLTTHNGILYAAGGATIGYLYRYDAATDTWVNATPAISGLSRLEKIVSFAGKLYGLEISGSTTNFIRFD